MLYIYVLNFAVNILDCIAILRVSVCSQGNDSEMLYQIWGERRVGNGNDSLRDVHIGRLMDFIEN